MTSESENANEKELTSVTNKGANHGLGWAVIHAPSYRFSGEMVVYEDDHNNEKVSRVTEFACSAA